ncbi:hypothetical protein F2Q69_00061843 [Brassica cretica]|uniref:Uncharacterized protein n=1 Tax=Brassica cretica TaxID=69181 RepID=A0A8S9RH27_BRACR|nr:hypothetical protein F2Q69_00061843 [Brassica cretica]
MSDPTNAGVLLVHRYLRHLRMQHIQIKIVQKQKLLLTSFVSLQTKPESPLNMCKLPTFTTGSGRGKENAASVLLQLCLNSPKFCTLVLQEGAIPPLVALSQSGTQRAKEKAQQLLSHFRNQRDARMKKGRS